MSDYGPGRWSRLDLVRPTTVRQLKKELNLFLKNSKFLYDTVPLYAEKFSKTLKFIKLIDLTKCAK